MDADARTFSDLLEAAGLRVGDFARLTKWNATTIAKWKQDTASIPEAIRDPVLTNLAAVASCGQPALLDRLKAKIEPGRDEHYLAQRYSRLAGTEPSAQTRCLEVFRAKRRSALGINPTLVDSVLRDIRSARDVAATQ